MLIASSDTCTYLLQQLQAFKKKWSVLTFDLSSFVLHSEASVWIHNHQKLLKELYLMIYCICIKISFSNERSRINSDGMYVGKVYSDMNRVTINKTFQGAGRLLAVHPQTFSSTFGTAGPVMAWLNEVAVGRLGVYPHLMSGHPFSPVPHLMRKVETCPGGELRPCDGGSTLERWRCPEIEEDVRRMERKTNKNNKMGLRQHPLYKVLVFPCWSLTTV